MDSQDKKILNHFTKKIEDYDYYAEKVVFKNEEVHQTLIKAIPFKESEKIKILDLGSGTGRGMFLILKRFFNSDVTGIDFSENMIEKSKKNLEDFKGRFDLIDKDFNDVPFDKDCDAIVSAIAIHNSSHKQKKELFKTIFDSLKKDGVFINGDFIEGETEEINEKYKKIYRAFLEKNLSGEERKVWINHAFSEDKPMKISEQTKILNEIGFSNIQVLWRFNNEAVYIAKKP